MNLHYLEMLELTRRIHAGEYTPVEVTQAMLARIESIDPTISSYQYVSAEAALAAAHTAEAEIRAGRIRGPLHGAPIALKDLIWTTDAPTAAGTAIKAGYLAPEDATVTRRLREAGAIILGKLKLTEGAYTDHHTSITPPRNPWNLNHWAGASSSGSGAATAAGLCFAALGTDTGGSIRFPCGANGLTGIKPTWGRVSRHGVFDFAPTLDHVGPMARSALDAGAMLGIIAGADRNDPTAALRPAPDYLAESRKDVKGLRLGFDARWVADADKPTQEVLDHVRAVAAELDMVLVEVDFPDSAQVVADWFPLCGVEAAVAHEDNYPIRREAYGPSLGGLIDGGRSLSGLDYEKLVLRRLAFTGRVARVFEQADLLLAPVQEFSAPTVTWMGSLGTNPELVHRLHKFTSPFNSTGNPTITLPGGFTQNGLPIAFQFVAEHWREDLLVRAGIAFQRATDWHRKHPSP